MRANLAERQWEGYPSLHADRLNLLLHIVAVPAFLIANVSLVVALVRLDAIGAALSALGMVVAFGVQGAGHQREREKPIFEGPADVAGRIFLEQWVNFPRFVLSGRWFAALRK